MKDLEQKAKELKSCPFCGNTDLHISATPSNDGTVTFYRVNHAATTNCSVSMVDSNIDELIKSWNASSLQTEVSDEEIEKEIDDLLSEDYNTYNDKEEDAFEMGFRCCTNWLRSKTIDSWVSVEDITDIPIHKYMWVCDVNKGVYHGQINRNTFETSIGNISLDRITHFQLINIPNPPKEVE